MRSTSPLTIDHSPNELPPLKVSLLARLSVTVITPKNLTSTLILFSFFYFLHVYLMGNFIMVIGEADRIDFPPPSKTI